MRKINQNPVPVLKAVLKVISFSFASHCVTQRETRGFSLSLIKALWAHPCAGRACPCCAYLSPQITNNSLASPNRVWLENSDLVCICCQLRPFILLNTLAAPIFLWFLLSPQTGTLPNWIGVVLGLFLHEPFEPAFILYCLAFTLPS